MTSLEPRPLGYLPALDGIRGIAVLSVVGMHLGYCAGGNAGVTLFFTLSGFLITALLLEEHDAIHSINLRHFYIRRALRLLPALFAMIAIDVIFVLAFRTGWERKAGLAGAAATLLYVSNWLGAFRILPLYQLDHTWSLAVEEQFYFIWPVLLSLLLRLRVTRRQLALLIGVAAVGFALERFALGQFGAVEMRLYTGLDTRADALLMGAGAALVFRYRLADRVPWGKRTWDLMGWLALVLVSAHLFFGLGVVPRSTSFASLGTYTAVSVVATVLILALTASRRGWLHAVLTIGPLQYVGKISYGVYLYHYLMFAMIDNIGLTWSPWLQGALKVSATAAVCVMSYRFLERPCLGLKHRFARADHA